MIRDLEEEERYEKKNIERDGEEETIVVFELEGEEFGIDVGHVLTINKYQTPTRIPQTPPYIEGVINLRGEIIVIINLRKKFGYPDRPVDDETRIIVVEVEDKRLGLVVDAVKEVLRIPVSAIERAPPTISERIESEFIIGVAVLGERLIVLLDIETLFQKHEMEEVAGARSVGARIHELIEKEKKKHEIEEKSPGEKKTAGDKGEENKEHKKEKEEKKEKHEERKEENPEQAPGTEKPAPTGGDENKEAPRLHEPEKNNGHQKSVDGE